MPFDVYKAGVKIVRDEAVVKKWIEDQSFKTEFTVLNVPDPLKLATLEDVENHFRAAHKESIIKSVETHVVGGVLSRNLRSRGLQQLIRQEWEGQRHFPLQLASTLSQQFAHHGLQFFKVNKTVTHVAVARPQFLDLEATPVSENIKRIVEHINATPKCTRKKLIAALAPTPQPTVIAITPDAAPAPAAEATPEQTALIADLHWLAHQGHIIEFADGRLETAKKPLPKPPKAEKKSAEAKIEKTAGEGEVAVAAETAPTESVAAETPVVPVPEAPTAAEPTPTEPVA
jgi:hypothetical protein